MTTEAKEAADRVTVLKDKFKDTAPPVEIGADTGARCPNEFCRARMKSRGITMFCPFCNPERK